MKGVDKSDVPILIDFTKSWELIVKVGKETIINLGALPNDNSMKTKLLRAIGTGQKSAEPGNPYDPSAIMDDNSTDAYLAYSMYFSPEEANNIQIHSKMIVKSLNVNGNP